MIFLPILLVALLSSSTLRELHGLWTDNESKALTHGYLVAAASLYLLWRAAGTASARDLRFSPRALATFGVLAFAWMSMAIAGFRFVEILLLPLLFGVGVWASFGPQIARRSAFPVGYLWFATPVPFIAALPLQWLTVLAVGLLLRLAAIPAYVDGNLVRIPSGTFEIEGGCGGIQFFVVAASLAALLGELREDSLRQRIRLVVVAALIACVTNWIRVFAIIVAGHHSHMQHYLVTKSHYGFGWILFAIAMLFFLLFEGRQRGRRLPRTQASGRLASSAGTPSMMGLLSLMGIVIGFAAWHRLALRPAQEAWNIGPAPDGWSQLALNASAWTPRFDGVEESRVDHWRDSNAITVDRYVGLYRLQAQGKEFSGYHNEPLAVDSDKRWLSAANYRVGRREYASPHGAQLAYAALAISGLRAPLSEVQVLRAQCMPDCSAAERALREWGIDQK